jgi:serine protease
MFHFINKIKSIFFLISICVGLIGYSQELDETLPNTVIFKLKEKFRTKSTVTKIDLPVLNQVLKEVGVTKLEKMFPRKIKEEKAGNIDLSLIYELTYTNSFLVNDVIRKLNKLGIAEYVEPYYLPKLFYTPNDTIFPNQYFLNLIQAENAWNITQGDTNVVIGITDTGWDPNHTDLLGNVKINYADPVNGSDDDGDGYIDNYLGWDLGMDDNNALWESTSHGVNVTGLSAAVTDNVTGISSAGFNCKFLPIKISNSVGQLTEAYQGIVYAADHGCFVINCSWGSYVPSQFSQNIVDYATINLGSLVVGAVGNDNGETVFYPAGYKGVLSVAASEQSDLKKNNSNYGYYVDVSAPGEAMWTTGANGGFSTNGGTSMAAPVVAGGAALLKSQFPSYNNYQIAALIQATADDLNALNPSYIDKLGSGRLNLFNGVSATSVQFVDLTKQITTDNNDNIFVFGDTLYIEGFFQNYLDFISGLTVTITSTSPYVNVIDGMANLPNMNTLITASNSLDKFVVEVLSGAPFNEVVTFKAVITNGTFTNNEYFTVILNPDYINLDENLVATTITSNGKIGFNDISNSVGLGFTYSGEQILYEAGLMIGDATTRVADVVRGGAGQDQDFSSQQNVAYNPPYVSALDLYGVLDDSPLGGALMDIRIEQFSYAYQNAPDDKYVIVMYDIENTGLTTLTNLYAGIFADWDIVDYTINKAAFDATRKMGYAYSMTNDTIYAAIKLLSSGIGLNYSLDLDGSGGIDVNNGGFITSEKYGTLSTNRSSAGGVGGADIAHVVATGNFSLNPGEHEIIGFAIIAGDSLQDIQASADAAQNSYDSDALSIAENNESDLSIYPNPTTGELTIFSDEVVELIIIRNVLGEKTEEFTSSKIDISTYPNGIYFVEVATKESRVVRKIVLSK